MKYTILREDNGTDLISIDRVEMKIKKLQFGHFEDVTKACERMANSKTKRDCAGATWFNSMRDNEFQLPSYYNAEHFDSKESFFNELVKCQIAGASAYMRVVSDQGWHEPHCLGY